MAGDACGQHHCHLHVHDGPWVHGGGTVEKKPYSEGNLDKDAAKIKKKTCFTQTLFLSMMFCQYNLNVGINGIFF